MYNLISNLHDFVDVMGVSIFSIYKRIDRILQSINQHKLANNDSRSQFTEYWTLDYLRLSRQIKFLGKKNNGIHRLQTTMKK